MEYLDLVIDPQVAIEYAYPRWRVWRAEETAEWWAAVRVNLTVRDRERGCGSYRCAETPGELAQLLDAEDVLMGVNRSLVRLVAWGLDDDHLRQAYGDFGLHPVRPLWRVAAAASSTAGLCPLTVDDPKVIVAHAGDGWAYAVYPLVA